MPNGDCLCVLIAPFGYPWQMTLGAIQNDSLIYEMGLDVAETMPSLGVHINFAPVVDVNSNPNNPIINNRSFGENPSAGSQTIVSIYARLTRWWNNGMCQAFSRSW